MPQNIRILRKQDGQEISGTYLHAFIHNGDYFLTEIKIYADGKIDCWGLVDFAEFKEKVRTGWVVTQIPEGSKIKVSNLAILTATGVNAFVDEDEFVKEVSDEIRDLKGEPTSSDKCRSAYNDFIKAPSDSAREELKKAYEAVPKHLRRFVLHDQDAKDSAIKRIIYERVGPA